jgi:hypothetical protein
VSYCNVIHIEGNVVDAKANIYEHYVKGMLLSLDLMLEVIPIEKKKKKRK